MLTGLYPSLSFAEDNSFLNSPIGQVLLDAGLKFLENPVDLFTDMKAINEDLSPVIPGRRITFRLNTTFLPFLFPFSWPGISLKGKLVSETPGVPQIDLLGEYGEIAAMRAVSAKDLSRPPSFSDYMLGLNVIKSVTKQTRLFIGGKYSVIAISYAPKDPITFGSFSMSSLDINVNDTYFFTGIEHHSESNPDKYIVAYVGYGFKFNKIISRISMNYRHLELGFTVFPEGMLVIQPTLAYHWYFFR